MSGSDNALENMLDGTSGGWEASAMWATEGRMVRLTIFGAVRL